MILYKDNKIRGKYKMSNQEIANEYVTKGKIEYDHMAYYGLLNCIIYFISTELGSFTVDPDEGTEPGEALQAQKDLEEIYDLAKTQLREKKLGIYGPNPNEEKRETAS